MFVRNVGDEGYCSHQLWQAPFTTYTFRLPWRDNMGSVEALWGVNKSQFEGTAGTTGPTVTYVSVPGAQQGVYVSFTLPPASQSPLIDGALHLKWTVAPGLLQTSRGNTPPPTRVTSGQGPQLSGTLLSATDSSTEDIDEAEHKILAAVNQLPPAQRTTIQKAHAGTSARAAMHALPPRRSRAKRHHDSGSSAYESATRCESRHSCGETTARCRTDSCALRCYKQRAGRFSGGRMHSPSSRAPLAGHRVDRQNRSWRSKRFVETGAGMNGGPLQTRTASLYRLKIAPGVNCRTRS